MNLYTGVATAAGIPTVSVVSISWGSPESSSDSAYDSQIFTTPADHQGVTFVAGSGDRGSPGDYPAFSPNVLAVGGTSLVLNADGSYGSETGWGYYDSLGTLHASGGGRSQFEPQPVYQSKVVPVSMSTVQGIANRTSPDVAFDANKNTGVPVFDSYDANGNGPASWRPKGGTSLGAPCWAGLIALANQLRVAAGGTTLDGASQTLPGLYALPSTDFHDITSGSNGTYNAGPGYDLVTGLGSPVANFLVRDLASVVSTTTTLNSNSPTAVYGQQITFTAAVNFTGAGAITPTGTVDFVDTTTNTDLGSAPVNADGIAIVTTSVLSAGRHVIAASYLGSGTVLASQALYAQTVTQATLSVTGITASNKVYDGTTTASLVTSAAVLVGVIGTDVVTLDTGGATGTFASPDVGTGITVTIAGLTIAGAQASNYTLTQPSTTADLTPAPLTITANNASKTYGQTLTFTGSEFTTGILYNDDAVTGVTLTSTGMAATAMVAGSPYAIVPSAAVGSGLGNYTITYENGSLTVTPAPLTITPDDQTMTYGGRLPSLTVTYTGLVNGDTPGTFTTAGNTPPSVTTVSAKSHAGTYAITASGASNPNYTINYGTGTLTINQAALTITADNKSMIYGGRIPFLTVTYKGLVNGDTASTLIRSPNHAPILATVPLSSHVGSYPIVVSGAVDADYAITYVAGTLRITPAALTITANNRRIIYGGTLPPLTVTYRGLVNGDTASTLSQPPDHAPILATAPLSSHVGSYPIVASGAVDADYAITYVAGTLRITPAALTITANNKSRVFGQANPPLTATISGLVNGDTPASLIRPPTLTTTATLSSRVGNYPIVASGAVDTNYVIKYVKGTLTVLAYPTPALASIFPNRIAVGYSSPLTMTVTGSNFYPQSVVDWNSAALLTTYVSPTQLTASIPASDLGSVGNSKITVANPAPGGGVSKSLTFQVLPIPTNIDFSKIGAPTHTEERSTRPTAARTTSVTMPSARSRQASLVQLVRGSSPSQQVRTPKRSSSPRVELCGVQGLGHRPSSPGDMTTGAGIQVASGAVVTTSSIDLKGAGSLTGISIARRYFVPA